MTSQVAAARLRRLEWTAAAFIMLLTLCEHGLRLVHAGGLWRDEAGEVSLATLPTLRAVFLQFPHESFPLAVPMAIRLYAWIAGDSDQALRWLGLAIGVAIVGALWLSARITGRHLPLLSLALIAGSASFVIFGDSLRGYGLGSLGILLAYAGLARLLAWPGAGSAMGALLAVLFAVHCWLGNSALAAALCAAALITALRRGNRRAALAVLIIGAAAALSMLAYALPLSAAARWSVIAVDHIGLSQVVAKLGTAVGPAGGIWLGLAGLAVFWALWGARGGGGESRGGGWAADGGADLLMADGAAHRETAAPEATRAAVQLFSALAIVLATAAELLFLDILSYTPRVWYYLPLVALVAAAIEPLVADLSRAPWARLARLGLAAGLAAALLTLHLPELQTRMTNVDLIARELAPAASADDLVLVVPWYIGVSFNRYYRGPARWTTVPEVSDHRFHRYDLLKTRLAAASPLAEVMAGARRALAAGHRVWVVGDLRVPPRGQAAPMLPPAPEMPSGWKDTPYLNAWSLQLGAFLRDHAAALRRVPVPSPDPVSAYEDLSLTVARGWR
jgi:hypothetical protein